MVDCLEDHPRTCKWWSDHPHLEAIFMAIWKGSHNPILRGLTTITMVTSHLHPLGSHPPSTSPQIHKGLIAVRKGKAMPYPNVRWWAFGVYNQSLPKTLCFWMVEERGFPGTPWHNIRGWSCSWSISSQFLIRGQAEGGFNGSFFCFER